MNWMLPAAWAALAVVLIGAADVSAQGFDDGFRPAPTEAAPTEAAPPMAEPTPSPDNRISLVLSDGTRLVGKPVDVEELDFKTEYGELTVPLKKIAGLRFSDYPVGGGENACSIHFTNGDRLWARLQLKSIKLETLVGEVDAAGGHLRSMVMSVDDKAWVQVGEEWKLMPVARPGRVYAAPSDVPPTYSTTPAGPYTEPSYAPAPSGYSGYATPAYLVPTSPEPVAPPMAR